MASTYTSCSRARTRWGSPLRSGGAYSSSVKLPANGDKSDRDVRKPRRRRNGMSVSACAKRTSAT
ncbi:hypothetical protein BU14_3120s0001 [Porphyra umbilicalis]|uniref:Uncharacterized protein n=1 Tax=Porphyra umbilicalis TaxID=2786 RepID=A0A1X6NI18_PORUM|nr:hypothetical protein BU14_3120s0001 [Porphyra umbilicalis]|eukprot:OSX68264.1 hypothetical protein BU14_3120s0001 [Porphyra umbilicalis]